MKKAILINAETQEIKETSINLSSEIAPAIGAEWFEIVQIDDKNALYVDEEGLFKKPEHFIVLKGYPQPLAGNALILGSNLNTGESCDTSLTVEQVKDRISFVSRKLIASEGRDLLL